MFPSSALSCGSHVFRPSMVSAPWRVGHLPEGAEPGVIPAAPHVCPGPGLPRASNSWVQRSRRPSPRLTLLWASGSLSGPFTVPPEPPRPPHPLRPLRAAARPAKGARVLPPFRFLSQGLRVGGLRGASLPPSALAPSTPPARSWSRRLLPLERPSRCPPSLPASLALSCSVASSA